MISSFLRMSLCRRERQDGQRDFPEGLDSGSRSTESDGSAEWSRSYGSTGGNQRHAVTVINALGIVGMTFGSLVTIALLVGYLDEQRVTRRRLKEAKDNPAVR
jgi:hypothetical protein